MCAWVIASMTSDEGLTGTDLTVELETLPSPPPLPLLLCPCHRANITLADVSSECVSVRRLMAVLAALAVA